MGRFWGEIRPRSLLKWPTALYRPAVPERNPRQACRHGSGRSLLGRSQAVRQRILIPPFGGSIPPAPATRSHVWPSFPRDARMGRKSRLFAHSLSSLDPRFAEVEAEIAKSLQPSPRIFPFCGDYRRRLVRSPLDGGGGSEFTLSTGWRGKVSKGWEWWRMRQRIRIKGEKRWT